MRGDRVDLPDVITDNAKQAVSRRGEVLTGPERRRKWPLKKKLAIVAESFEPGAVVSHVAGRHGIKPQQLFDWRRQVREHAPGRALPTLSALTEPPTFAPVIVADEAAAELSPRTMAATQTTSGPSIEITIGVATVRINGSADAKTLKAVLSTLTAIGTTASGRMT